MPWLVDEKRNGLRFFSLGLPREGLTCERPLERRYLLCPRARSSTPVTRGRRPCRSCGEPCSPPPENATSFDPFLGLGTTAVAAERLNRAFVGTELEEEFAGLAARRVCATRRGSLLQKISEQFRAGP